jgi:1,4-alpha-glucan branching enzyme
VIGYHRWHAGGRGDDVIAVLNLSNSRFDDYRLGVPGDGIWAVRLDTDRRRYGPDYGGGGADSVDAAGIRWDGLSHSVVVALAPYSALVLSQDRP